jgi:hypothetical protein
MDYPFENLNPERFQDFCQALLTKEFPGVQCLPVAQPDGGRDAFVQGHAIRGDSKMLIFQVKFSRKPSEISDPEKWLLDIADGEREKVNRLIVAGAKVYYLLTNVSGSAHFGTGTIDKVNDALTKSLGISSQCMWRTDLSRRLDNAWNLKWTYPELMTGPDLIRYAIEQGLNEHGVRRANAIRAFVRSQYSFDEQVKFKQVDLQNHLLDLFVDVPLRSYHGYVDADQRLAYHQQAQDNQINEKSIGAVSFLLNEKRAGFTRYFVLEGAPGQGKSTISQYICQVNRMRLLERTEDIIRVLPGHRTVGIELPIKADLRDFATWLARKDPFGTTDNAEHLRDWAKTLESFLAALIRVQSGGASFDVSDLQAILSHSATIIVLDGLDEVADIRRRSEVVAEITKGVERLSAIASGLRVIVTSRPAAFANSPGLTRELFKYVSLGDLTRDVIVEYAEKWLKALRAEPSDADSVRRILKSKLDLPHIRDLARNPMQLAILLSLIHTKGVSLPDKRTALYDSYVDRFFNREAEKSVIVRENRDLLLNIHRYLAWLLHSESESSTATSAWSSGAITVERLKKVVRDYLAADCRSEALVDDLFTGVVERIVALVSRVEGTYEFEVQPLREFFAARYLYETAPYSPPGNERKGTKPDRFNAVARNFYWLNVTRFLAGCYSIGELASLIDSIQELLESSDFSKLRHPRVLAATLLGDWVFAQQYRSVAAVTNLLLDDLSFRLLLAHTSVRSGDGHSLSFPKESGNEQLIVYAFELLKRSPQYDYALDIAEFVSGIAPKKELLPRWTEFLRTAQGDNVARWLEYGRAMGCLSIAPFELVTEALDRTNVGNEVIRLLIVSDRTDILEYRESHIQSAIDAILGSASTVLTPTKKRLNSSRPITRLAAVLNPQRFARFSYADSDKPLAFTEFPPERAEADIAEIEPPLIPESIEREKLLRFLRAIEPIEQIKMRTWATSLGPWSFLIDEIVKAYGDRELGFVYSLLASGIRNKDETCMDCPEFFDATKPLIRRVRFARFRVDAVRWWKSTLRQGSTAGDFGRVCAVWIVTASRETLQQTVVEFDAVASKLSDKDWEKVFGLARKCVNVAGSGPQIRRSGAGWEILETISARMKLLLAVKFSSEDADKIRSEILRAGGTDDPTVLKELRGIALKSLGHRNTNWEQALKACRELLTIGVAFDGHNMHQYYRYSDNTIRFSAAEAIMREPSKYPTVLLSRAERVFRIKTARKARPVFNVSLEDGWFPDITKP